MTVELEILESYTRDVGRGVARIDYETMKKLKASTGDIISIIGIRKTVAKALPLYPSDEDKGMIRLDGLGRNNLRGAIGEKIKIKLVKLKTLEYAEFTPLEAIPPVDNRYMADALEAVPMIVGDNVMVPYFGGRLSFQVTNTQPGKGGIMTVKTKCTIVDKTEPLVIKRLPDSELAKMTERELLITLIKTFYDMLDVAKKDKE